MAGAFQVAISDSEGILAHISNRENVICNSSGSKSSYFQRGFFVTKTPWPGQKGIEILIVSFWAG